MRGEAITPYNMFGFPFYNMIEYLSRGIDKETSILDLGCGDKTLINSLPDCKKTTVDSFAKFSPDVLWDLNKTPLPFRDSSFEVVLLLDVIEHLDKDRGTELLKEAKRICTKRIFVFTPLNWNENEENTDNPKSEYYGNKCNLHKSLWTERDFIGFKRIANKTIEDRYLGYWEKV